MNAKKAKALRKVLKNLEKLNPQESLSGQSTTGYQENKDRRKMITIEDFDEKGELVKKTIPIAAGTITVEKASPRGLYLQLKKGLERGEK